MLVQPIMLLPRTSQAPVFAPALPGRTQPVDPVQPVQGRSPGTEASPQPKSDADTVEISSAARVVEQLSDAEQKVVYKLQDRDREVRAHEQAHLSAAGPYATSGPKYDYATGPDGKRYAVGGHVDIDVSPIKGDPEATLRKATIVRAAAMAASSPSSADQQVAAMASQMAADALAEIQAKNTFQSDGQTEAAAGMEAKPRRADRQPGVSGYDDQHEDELGTLFDALV